MLPSLSQEAQRGVGNGVGENPPFPSSLGMEIKFGSSLRSKCNERAGLNGRISWRPDERGWKLLLVSLSQAPWKQAMGGTGRALGGLGDPLTSDRSGGLIPLQSFPPAVPGCAPRCRSSRGQPACGTRVVFLVSRLFYQGNNLGGWARGLNPDNSITAAPYNIAL